jgi:hypothetical protein
MVQIIGLLITCLRACGWRFRVAADAPIVRVYPKARMNQLKCMVEVCEDEAVVVIYALYPAYVPAYRVGAVVDFITDANAELRVGALEIDRQAGVVAYRSGVPIEEGTLTPQLVRRLVTLAVATAEQYLPRLIAVLLAGAAASEDLDRQAPYEAGQVMTDASDLLDEGPDVDEGDRWV